MASSSSPRRRRNGAPTPKLSNVRPCLATSRITAPDRSCAATHVVTAPGRKPDSGAWKSVPPSRRGCPHALSQAKIALDGGSPSQLECIASACEACRVSCHCHDQFDRQATRGLPSVDVTAARVARGRHATPRVRARRARNPRSRHPARWRSAAVRSRTSRATPRPLRNRCRCAYSGGRSTGRPRSIRCPGYLERHGDIRALGAQFGRECQTMDLLGHCAIVPMWPG